mgnify:CR=1 FL=1
MRGCCCYCLAMVAGQALMRDITALLERVLADRPKLSISLMGYSFGACIVPFVANRLKGRIKDNLHELILLSPDTSGDFEIHVADMLSFGRGQDPYDVLAELKKTTGVRRLCLFGDGEDAGVAQAFKRLAGVQVDILPGGHHYNNNYDKIVERVLTSN